MSDTSPEFERIVAERYARMRPEERVRIAAGMFDTACAVVEASLPEGLDPAERRFRLCERLYGELAARAFPRHAGSVEVTPASLSSGAEAAAPGSRRPA